MAPNYMAAQGITLGLLLASLSPALVRAESILSEHREARPVLGDSLGGAVQDTVLPAYRFVEVISDGVYDFTRLHLIGNLLPGGLSRGLQPAPKQDSSSLFDKNLRAKEGRFLERAKETYPVAGADIGPSDPAQLRQWRSWAVEEQLSISMDAMKDALLERYQLEFLGGSAQTYAKGQGRRDPGFLTMAGLVGGSLLYLNGMHATAYVRDWKLGIDLRSLIRLQKALQNDSTLRGLANFELSYKDKPITVATELGVENGRLCPGRVGLNYRLRY